MQLLHQGAGLRDIYTAGPFSDPKGDWMKNGLDVDPRAVTTLTMVRCGPSQNVELFEYEAKNHAKTPPGTAMSAAPISPSTSTTSMLQWIPEDRARRRGPGHSDPRRRPPNGGETIIYFKTQWAPTWSC